MHFTILLQIQQENNFLPTSEHRQAKVRRFLGSCLYDCFIYRKNFAFRKCVETKRHLVASVAKHWIAKAIPRAIPSYGSQSKRAKIAIHWFGKYWYYCPQSPLFVSNSAEWLWGQDISIEHTYLGHVHPYPYIFSSANVSLRIQKFPRPHVAYIHTHIHFLSKAGQKNWQGGPTLYTAITRVQSDSLLVRQQICEDMFGSCEKNFLAILLQ